MYISKVVWTPQAREDIQAMKLQVLDREGRPGVERLRTRLASQLSLIQHFPLIGMANPDRKRIRKFLLNGYFDIVYEPRAEDIVIHAILPKWKTPWAKD
jgi:plasmid stabilization system protein ParE